MSAPYDFFDYPAYWKTRSFEDQCERIALRTFFSQIKKKDSLIDIGGGYGRLSSLYSPIFDRCVVLEPSTELIKIGKAKNKDFSNLFFKEGTLPFLPFQANSFDVALMIRVVHHLVNPLTSFKEVNRILKKNGYFILEVANKIHFLRKLKAIGRGNFSFVGELSPLEGRSPESIKEGKITFLNHHPLKIRQDIYSAGFKIVETLSVSNLRSQFLKKIVPERWLLFLEEHLQKPLSGMYFGPSIFYLAKKI